MISFAKRCVKEILRDRLNVFFGLGFPLVLLVLLTTIGKNIPVDLFEINSLVPAITVFGLSFMALFSATLVSKDRESSFLSRLYTSPLKAKDFILGYMLSLLPLAIGQTGICYIFAIPFGFDFTMNTVIAILFNIPIAVFNISIGLLCGSLLGVKQVGGVCGALLTNLSAWFSGVSFDVKQVGGFFEGVANFLPFIHAAEMGIAICNGSYIYAFSHLLPVTIYSILTLLLAILCFVRQMKSK